MTMTVNADELKLKGFGKSPLIFHVLFD